MSYLGDDYEELLCRYNREVAENKKQIILLQEKLRDACRLIFDIKLGIDEPMYSETEDKATVELILSHKNMLKLERYATMPKCAYNFK